MAAANRADKIGKLITALKKRFKPTPPIERPLFETLLYACLVENSTHDAAEKAIEQLEKSYFDWNEVRVSTRAELTEVLKPLSDPAEAADRLKRTLQSIFETVYAFDLEPMKKQNLGQSVKQIAGQDGVTPFVVGYVTQNGLGGHAIACNDGLMLSFLVLDVITEAEHKKGAVPGLERAVPKNKGVEIGSILHQLGVEVGRNPYGTAARKLLTDLDPSCKSRLPKRPQKEKEPEPKPEPKPDSKADSKAKAKAPKDEKKPSKAEPKAAKAETSAADPTKKPAKKAAPAKKAPAKKKVAKKKAATKKKTAKKKAPAKKKTTKKKTTKKAAKKPAKKKTAKKKAKRK